MKQIVFTFAIVSLAGIISASASGRGNVAGSSHQQTLKGFESNQATISVVEKAPAAVERTTFALSAKKASEPSVRYYGTSQPRSHR
ncbi:MAG: hypothetical protein AAGD22_08165 [Verrucomicrobiota bacterium]